MFRSVGTELVLQVKNTWKNCNKNSLRSLTTIADNSAKSKLLPPPIRVSRTEFSGRGTFATRKICAGEVIHTAKPLVAHPSLSHLHKACYFCLKILGNGSSAIFLPFHDSKMVSFEANSSNTNGSVFFCSEECKEHSKIFYEVEKKGDWTEFNEYCRKNSLKYPLLVKRLACMIISGTSSADILDILQPDNLSNQMILKMEVELELLRDTFMKAGIEEKQFDFLTKEWYINVLARIRINAFRIELIGSSYEDLFSAAAASIMADAVGNAIYMMPSFYNHDCGTFYSSMSKSQ